MMGTPVLKHRGQFWATVTTVALLTCTAYGQINESRIRFQPIQKEYHRNWLLIRSSVDLTVSWEVARQVETNGQISQEWVSPSVTPYGYEVILAQFDVETTTESVVATKQVWGQDFARFEDINVGPDYLFRVRAIHNGDLVAEGQSEPFTPGKAAEADATQDWTYFLNPGRWLLATVNRTKIYDDATTPGKVAFILLSVIFLVGFSIVLIFSSRTLYLGNIFPYARSWKKFLLSLLALSADRSFRNRLTTKFRFVLEAWGSITESSKEAAEQEAERLVQTAVSGGGNTGDVLDQVELACLKYWTGRGKKGIGVLEDILTYPDGDHFNGDETAEALKNRIRESFGELLANGNPNPSANHAHSRFDLDQLIQEIVEPVEIDERPLPKIRKWLLRKGIFQSEEVKKKGLAPFPTTKIIVAGLENHKINGYRWMVASQEVDRAFENRASSELETLRKKSKIDWLWNFGGIAPLIGLFGTVTGITSAFHEISSGRVENVQDMLKNLGGGIYEALYTTIFGLVTGIVLVFVYYYYKSKLDWIYAKWEEIYVKISEKL